MDAIWGLGCKPYETPYNSHMILHMVSIWVTYDNATGEEIGWKEHTWNDVFLWLVGLQILMSIQAMVT